jgi:drug/metabolite transporter (DMT)-like permease
MGIIAPITAVLAASLPVIFSALTLGLPRPLQLAGFALALLSVVLVSRPERLAGRPAGLGLALLAGLGFGGFFILIGQVSAHALFWPLACARVASLLFMLVFIHVRGEPMLPKKQGFLLILLAGALDVAGNVFFILAAHAGRLDVATILSSLYPAMTVLLAALILRERVSRLQATGIALALAAIVLISA